MKCFHWNRFSRAGIEIHGIADRAELERLQRIVIGDARFVYLGLRTEGGGRRRARPQFWDPHT